MPSPKQAHTDLPPRLDVLGLRITLPNGEPLIRDFNLTLHAGQVAVILGGSGAGKSTFARLLFESEKLREHGFEVQAKRISFDQNELGLVPQHGALFDHLDVAGNLDLALRYATRSQPGTPSDWLTRVGLDPSLASKGRQVGQLSGGQAQRVAVARVLAGNRQLLFLDEPSVGLDPHRVRMLARLVRQQVENHSVSAVVVTHDIAFAAGVADQLHILNAETQTLEPLFADQWPGPAESPNVTPEQRGHWMLRLEQATSEVIAKTSTTANAVRDQRSRWARLTTKGRELIRPFAAAGTAITLAPGQFIRRPRDFGVIVMRVAKQALIRPAVFYALVATLIGYTILYVISKIGGAGVRPDALIRQIGGSYIVALAPPMSAILFVAASGSATNAWLGSVGLTKQAVAMTALGVNTHSYLWAPSWLTVGLSYLCVAGLFIGGMIVGGLLVCAQYDIPNAWQLLSADFLDPRPERATYAMRALFLIWMYAWGIASDTVAKGSADKSDADAVTRSMTRSVVACTLWVVSWELATVMAVLQ